MKQTILDNLRLNGSIHLAKDGVMLDDNLTQNIFANAFLEINKRYPAIVPLDNVNSLSVMLQAGSPLLIPAVNGRAATQLESEFTMLIKSQGLRIKFIPRLDLSQGDDAFTLGYIASKGWLSVRVKNNNRPWFESKYFNHTGEYAPDPKRGNYYVVIPQDVAGRWDNYYVVFNFPQPQHRDMISFGGECIKWNDWVGGAKVHSRTYLFNLLHMGFQLGYNTDNIEVIRDFVSDADSFDMGVATQAMPIQQAA